MTWPLITTLGQRIPAGVGGDVWAHQWAHWWVKYALTNGLSPFFSNLIYFPSGVSLATYNIPWVNIALWLPLQAIIGNYAAYSLIFIAVYAFNCFVMFFLVMDWYDSLPAAFIAGLIFGFFPYVLSRSGQSNWIFISWLPLALLFLNRTVQNGRIRDAVISGVLIALIGISRWHLLILSSIVITIFLIYLYIQTDRFTRHTFLILGLCVLIATILMFPFAWPVISELIFAENSQDFFKSGEGVASTNLLAYFVPNTNLTVGGKIVSHLPGQLQFTGDRIEFIGLTVLMLAVIGSIAYLRKAWPWILILAILMLLALGPVLQIGSTQLEQIPTLYNFLEDFFFVRILRYATRFNILLGLPLALLAALGVLTLQRNQFIGKRPLLLTMVLGMLILGEYLQIPYRTTETTVPVWYEQLAQEQDHFAILDLPLQPGGTYKVFMHYQMTHGKALVGGHVSRLSRDAYEFIEDSPILSSLRKDNSFGAANTDVSHQLNTLSDAGIRYIVLHKQYESDSKIEEWKDWLTVDPYYQDDDLIVYRTNPIYGQDFDFVYQLTDDIGLVAVNYWPNQVNQAEQVGLILRWGANEKPDKEYKACIQLLNNNGGVSQSDCSAIPDSWPTTEWQDNEVVRADFDLRIDPILEPGNYSLKLILFNTDQEVGESLILGNLVVGARPQINEIQVNPIPADAEWEDLITLRGNETNQSGGFLQLTLHWQAMKHIDRSYKYFVHLVDLDSGRVAAQIDAIPRNWTYPTDSWGENEIVVDTVEIPLSDINPGIYRLQVGFYDPETGERLYAKSASGQPYTNNAVILTDIELRY